MPHADPHANRFRAFAAPDTIDAISERIGLMVLSGRRMALARRELVGDGALTVRAGLVPSPRAFFGKGDGIDRWSYEGGNRGITVQFEPGGVLDNIGVGASMDPEAEVRRRYHEAERAAIEHRSAHPYGPPHELRPRDVTLVEASGFTTGSEDWLRVTYWNEVGYGVEKTLTFDQGLSDAQQAEADARVLDVAAERLGLSHDDGSTLVETAAAIRYWRTPLTDWLDSDLGSAR